MTGTLIMIKTYQRKSATVVYLCRQHETNLVQCSLRIRMNDTLNILNGISVTISVTLTAVDEGCCS